MARSTREPCRPPVQTVAWDAASCFGQGHRRHGASNRQPHPPPRKIACGCAISSLVAFFVVLVEGSYNITKCSYEYRTHSPAWHYTAQLRPTPEGGWWITGMKPPSGPLAAMDSAWLNHLATAGRPLGCRFANLSR